VLYNPHRTAWAETIEFNYFNGMCRYNFFLRSPHPQEVAAFANADIDISILIISNIIFIPIFFSTDRVPDLLGDAAFNWWNLPENVRERPIDLETYLLQAVLIDADNGIVKGVCILSLPPEFTAKLKQAIDIQIDGGEISRDRFELVVSNVQQKHDAIGLAEIGGLHRIQRGSG
jgi:hypothetical protein